jgi:glycosyltransferase involved in cell wall biosynthesis
MNDKTQLKYSIVIPLYNKASTINRAIDSIFSQKHDVEILIVDDGSTDQGPSIIKNRNDVQIKLIQQENHGVSHARNIGIKHSSNELVAFLDADDQWHVGYLDMIDFLVQTFPSAGAYSTSYKIDDDEGLKDLNHPQVTQNFIGVPNYFKWAKYGQFFCSSSIVVRKTALKTIEGFREDLWYAEDVDMWSRLALLFSIAYSSEALVTIDHKGNDHAIYRPHPANYTFIDSVNEYVQTIKKIDNEDLLTFTNYSLCEVALRNIWWGYPSQAMSILALRPSNRLICKIIKCYLFSLLPICLVTLARSTIHKIKYGKTLINKS